MILIKFIFGFFFLLLAVGLLLGFAVFARLYGEVRRLKKLFGGGSAPRTERGATGEPTVADRRTPEQAGRKIFGADEGEYVDFEE